MIDQKKAVIHLIVFYLLVPSLALADWKTDINQYLKEERWVEAQILLENSLSSLAEPDRQEALAILPYIYHRLGQTEKEKQAIVNYFEQYNLAEPLFEFLDFSVFNPCWSSGEDGKKTILSLPMLIFLCLLQLNHELSLKCFAWALTCRQTPIIKFKWRDSH